MDVIIEDPKIVSSLTDERPCVLLEGGGLEAVEADVLPVEVVVVVVEVRFVLDLEFVRSFVSEIVLANPSKIKY